MYVDDDDCTEMSQGEELKNIQVQTEDDQGVSDGPMYNINSQTQTMVYQSTIDYSGGQGGEDPSPGGEVVSRSVHHQ